MEKKRPRRRREEHTIRYQIHAPNGAEGQLQRLQESLQLEFDFFSLKIKNDFMVLNFQNRGIFLKLLSNPRHLIIDKGQRGSSGKSNSRQFKIRQSCVIEMSLRSGIPGIKTCRHPRII